MAWLIAHLPWRLCVESCLINTSYHSFIRVTCLVHMYDMTQRSSSVMSLCWVKSHLTHHITPPYVWHASSICMTRVVRNFHMYDMSYNTHVLYSSVSFAKEPCKMSYICMTWVTYILVSLLQKSPVKETLFCNIDIWTMCMTCVIRHVSFIHM